MTIPRSVSLCASALIAALGSMTTASACRVSSKYMDLSVEQKITLEPLVFLGRVVRLENGVVKFLADEVLKGPVQPVYMVRQSSGTDCQHIFIAGNKVFFVGSLDGAHVFGPTHIYTKELPAKLLPIIEKLRRREPFEPLPEHWFE
jgi:hypothetical protein